MSRMLVLTGDRQLNKLLNGLASDALKKKLTTGASKKAMRHAADALRRTVPMGEKPGDTIHYRNMIVTRVRKKSRSAIGAKIGVRGGGEAYRGSAYYAAFLEMGWLSGKRRTGKTGNQRRKIAGRWWMRQATAESEPKVMATFREELRKAIDAEAQKA